MAGRTVVATRRHSQTLAGLHYLTHTQSFRNFADESWIAGRQMSDYLAFWNDHFANRKPRECTWAILHAGQAIGTATIVCLENSSRHFRPTPGHCHPDAAVACLRLMYVHPGFFRRGVGTRLLEKASSFMRCQGYRIGVLITHAANQRARAFYQSRGWILDEIIEQQVEEFFEEPPAMRLRARYRISIRPCEGPGV
jgi:GNAT superfamily N-acetyltransferase